MGLGLKVQDFGARPRTEGGIDDSFSVCKLSLSLSRSLSCRHTHSLAGVKPRTEGDRKLKKGLEFGISELGQGVKVL